MTSQWLCLKEECKWDADKYSDGRSGSLAGQSSFSFFFILLLGLYNYIWIELHRDFSLCLALREREIELDGIDIDALSPALSSLSFFLYSLISHFVYFSLH